MRVSKLFFILFLSTSAVSVKALDCWAMGDGDESDVVLEDLMELGEAPGPAHVFFGIAFEKKPPQELTKAQANYLDHRWNQSKYILYLLSKGKEYISNPKVLKVILKRLTAVVKKGGDFRFVSHGQNALHLVVHFRLPVEFLQVLLQNAGLKDINKQDCEGNTALHYACRKGMGVDYFIPLVSHGANPLLCNINGQVPQDSLSPEVKPLYLEVIRQRKEAESNPEAVKSYEGYDETLEPIDFEQILQEESEKEA